MTLRDLSEKDVIQLKTGENLGRIDDLAFEDGQITQVVLHLWTAAAVRPAGAGR